jgi:hypothetical protein
VVELGFTVMIGVPRVTVAATVKLPANTDWMVATPPPSPGATSTASVMMPDDVLIASLAAISLPSPPDGMSTAAGDVLSTSCASASALGATRYSPSAGSSSTYTLAAPNLASASVAASAAGPMNTADGSPRRRAKVSSSPVVLRTCPSTWSTSTRISVI